MGPKFFIYTVMVVILLIAGCPLTPQVQNNNPLGTWETSLVSALGETVIQTVFFTQTTYTSIVRISGVVTATETCSYSIISSTEFTYSGCVRTGIFNPALPTGGRQIYRISGNMLIATSGGLSVTYIRQ